MTYDLMIDYLKHQTGLIHGSFYVYEGSSLVYKTSPGFHDTAALIRSNKSFNELVSGSGEINYCIEDNLFAIGAVKNIHPPYTILIGPFRTNDNVESVSKTIYKRHSSFFGSIKETQKALLTLPALSISKLFNLLSTVFIALNQKTSSLSLASVDPESGSTEESVNKSIAETLNDYALGQDERYYSIEYEKNLIAAVKNGLVDKIDELEHDSVIGKLGASSPNNLRSLKNLTLTLNSICLRASIEGGVNEFTAYNLGDVFARMIEAATTVSTLRTTSKMIKREYCKQVHFIKGQKIEDPIALKARKYIYSNIHNKITAREIAEYIDVTPQYLSSRFSAATNTSIPDFILNARITEAKQLLRYSNLPLSEISQILAFSSQCYFQTQFKKVTGMTPMEYRNKKQLG